MLLYFETANRTSHFLIGINTPVCFYHPPGQPNEVIEVMALKPVTWGEKPITVEGVFSLVNNGEMGMSSNWTRRGLFDGERTASASLMRRRLARSTNEHQPPD